MHQQRPQDARLPAEGDEAEGEGEAVEEGEAEEGVAGEEEVDPHIMIEVEVAIPMVMPMRAQARGETMRKVKQVPPMAK